MRDSYGLGAPEAPARPRESRFAAESGPRCGPMRAKRAGRASIFRPIARFSGPCEPLGPVPGRQIGHVRNASQALDEFDVFGTLAAAARIGLGLELQFLPFLQGVEGPAWQGRAVEEDLAA